MSEEVEGGRDRDLRALRDRVRALEAVKCRLGHERIDRRPGSLAPLPSPIAEHGYARRSLCERAQRERRVGCAHTMARLLLADAIAAVGDGDGAALARELATVEQSIYEIDRERSDAELRHAQVADANAASGDPATAERELRDLEARVRALEEAHDACVDGLAALRDRVVSALSAAIATRGA